MKPYKLILLSAFALFAACAQSYSGKLSAPAKAGVLDLRGWDFNHDGPVLLKGQWEFYWQELLQTRDFKGETVPPMSGLFQVPGLWNGYELGGQKLPAFGYATFRLRVFLEPGQERLALYIPVQASAYKLYLNGMLLSSRGRVARNGSHMISEWLPQMVFFQNPGESLDIQLQISNFEYRHGGPWESIKLGTNHIIKKEREQKVALVLFLIGSLVIMGLYHLGVFIKRSKERAPLYFGLFCFLLSIQILMTGDRFLMSLFPGIPWELSVKCEYLTFYLAIPVFASFLNCVFPGLFHKRILPVIWLAASPLSLLILFTPADIYSHSLELYQLFSIFAIVYMLFLMVLAFVRKREGAVLFFLGSLGLSIATINDIMLSMSYVQSEVLLPYGLFVFIFSQAYLLSTRSSHAFNGVEVLTNEMEAIVQERTLEVEAGREQLEGLSEVSRQVSAAGDLPFVVTAVHQALVEHMGPLAVWILLVDRNRGELYTDSYRPIPGKKYRDEQHRFLKEFRLPLNEDSGALFYTYKERRTFLLERINKTRLDNSPVDKLIVETLGLTSVAHRALVVQNAVIGILCITGQGTVRRRHLKWLELFSDQTAGAVHLASLLAQAERARAEIHDLNRLSRRINQSTDVDAVLEDVFAYFQKTFGIDGNVVLLHDPGPNELFALKYSKPMARFKFEERVSQLFRFPLAPESGSLHRTFHRRKSFYVRDARKMMRGGRSKGIDLLILETLGISEILQVPLIIQNQSIGILCMVSLGEPMNLTKAELRSIERTSEQIAGAIYRSSLYKQVLEASEKAEYARKQVEQARGELTRLNQFSIKVNESGDLDGILKDVFAYFSAEFNIDSVIVQLIDQQKNQLFTHHTSEDPGASREVVDYARKFIMPLGEESGILYKAVKRQKPLYLPRINAAFREKVRPLVKELIDNLQLSSFLLVPLVIQNKTIGLVLCTSYTRLFRVNRTEIDSIARFCEQIAGAIYSSSLFRQLEENTMELALVNQSLQKMDRAKTRFFSNISHAFRTPLTLILAPVESILKGDFGESIKKNNITFPPILRNGRRLLRLINNLLDFTKIEAGRMEANKQKTDMVELLEHYRSSLSADAERRGLKLIFKHDSDILLACIDRNLMEKALINLLSNAFKFTAPGGEVLIQLEEQKRTHFQLLVQDSGIGVPKDKLKTIFERFSPADESTARKDEGTGIGLSLAKEIIELHDGSIGVESEPGQGTVFRIRLPKGEGAEPGDEPPEAIDLIKPYLLADLSQTPNLEPSGEAPEGPGEHTILIVEDNADMRSFLHMLLERIYTVHHAVNGREGMEQAMNLSPDLILSDVMMPEMDGYEMTRNLKSARKTRDIPVILLSAKADVAHRVEGLEFGADDYLSKPFNAEELMARIRNQIESKNLERDLKKKKQEREREFRQASLVQKSILTPREYFEKINELEIEVVYLPMNGAVSGDYYNITRREEGIASVFIADATGHGTQAALSTMQIDMLYRDNFTKKNPDEPFENINKRFVSELHSKNYFTGFIVDIFKDQIRYSSAGHPEQYLIRSESTNIQKLRTRGWMIGMRPEQFYKTVEVPVGAGDILLLFSDGIYEVFNAEGEEFGEERFLELIQAEVGSGLEGVPMKQVVGGILEQLDEFRGEVAFRDDITLIGVRIK